MTTAGLALLPPPASSHDTDVRCSSAYVRALCEGMRYLGHDSAQLLARMGIDPGRLVGDWFTLQELDALLVEAVASTGDPALGLHWAERSPMMQFDLGPSLFASAPSLRGGLEAIIRLQFLFANRAQCFLSQAGSRCTLSFDLQAASALGLRLLSELTVVSIQRGFSYLGQKSKLRRINLAYPRPAYGSEYDRLLGPKVRFDQPRTSVEFASVALDQRVGSASEPVHNLLLTHTELAREHMLHQLSFAEQVAQHLRVALPRLLSVGDVALALGVSARSLRRRLETEHTFFSDIVDRLQRERALELISRPVMSIKQIAYESGFSSTSGFHRAFRRWTGTSPTLARSRLLA